MNERSYIPYGERLAATLACLLPQEQRDQLRRDKVGSAFVNALFHFHHIEFHATGGSDLWWNLDPQLVEPHRERTAKIDIPMIAKGKRIRKKLAEHQARMQPIFAGPMCRIESAPPRSKIQQRANPWPKGRKLQSRGFRR